MGRSWSLGDEGGAGVAEEALSAFETAADKWAEVSADYARYDAEGAVMEGTPAMELPDISFYVETPNGPDEFIVSGADVRGNDGGIDAEKLVAIFEERYSDEYGDEWEHFLLTMEVDREDIWGYGDA